MSAIEKIDKIKKVSKALQPNQDLLENKVRNTNGLEKEQFDALMRQDKVNESKKTEQVQNDAGKKLSPIDEMHASNFKAERVTKASATDLIAQTENLIDKIDKVKSTLSSPNIKIKSSVQNLLRNKLTHIDDNIKIALSKAGVEYTPPEATSMVNPIERFLGYLTQGQYQLQHLSEEIASINSKNSEVTPANMLAIQIKVGYVQQELEFFTSLLNKALESTKTLMNVQV